MVGAQHEVAIGSLVDLRVPGKRASACLITCGGMPGGPHGCALLYSTEEGLATATMQAASGFPYSLRMQAASALSADIWTLLRPGWDGAITVWRAAGPDSELWAWARFMGVIGCGC